MMSINVKMANLFRLGFQFTKKLTLQNPTRFISLTQCLPLKEIKVTQAGPSITIEGVNIQSDRKDLLVKTGLEKEDSKICYMCALDLNVKHTDVLILSQFVRSDGCMLPRRVTGLCKRQQRKIGTMVTMAQKAGLMINLTPRNCSKDPTKRKHWKKFNTYFDETTIFQKPQPSHLDRFKRSRKPVVAPH